LNFCLSQNIPHFFPCYRTSLLMQLILYPPSLDLMLVSISTSLTEHQACSSH
jgi:hypothetical protein